MAPSKKCAATFIATIVVVVSGFRIASVFSELSCPPAQASSTWCTFKMYGASSCSGNVAGWTRTTWWKTCLYQTFWCLSCGKKIELEHGQDKFSHAPLPSLFPISIVMPRKTALLGIFLRFLLLGRRRKATLLQPLLCRRCVRRGYGSSSSSCCLCKKWIAAAEQIAHFFTADVWGKCHSTTY